MSEPLNDTPIRSQLLLSLATQGALLQELFSSIPSRVPVVPTALVQSSAALDALAAQAEEHQRRWAALASKKEEVEGLERRIRDIVRELEGNYQDLEAMVDEGKRLSESIDKSEICKLLCLDNANCQRRLVYRSFLRMRTLSRAQQPRRCRPSSLPSTRRRRHHGRTRCICARACCSSSREQ
jgi:hypothetical protein